MRYYIKDIALRLVLYRSKVVYIQLFAISSICQKYLKAMLTRQLDQPHRKSSRLKKFQFHSAPIEEQEKIVEEIEQHFSISDEIQKKL